MNSSVHKKVKRFLNNHPTISDFHVSYREVEVLLSGNPQQPSSGRINAHPFRHGDGLVTDYVEFVGVFHLELKL